MKRISFLFIIFILTGAFETTAQTAVLVLPSQTGADTNTAFEVPVLVSTDAEIGFAQIVFDYNRTILTFNDAQPGADANGFTVSNINTDLPFGPYTAGATDNVLVQLSGGGQNTVTGDDRELLVLHFSVNNIMAGSPLAIDPRQDHTYLATADLDEIAGDSLEVQNGIVTETEEVPGPRDHTTASLGQNFPNPVYDITHIPLEIRKRGRYQIRIFDSQGKISSTVLEGRLEPGTYDVSIDLKHFPSGLYYYTLLESNRSLSKSFIKL